ncbi:hypothetical protein [Burkholderia ubonensis]|uniref:hypothetical protein n=1 Tax=Burkholderia ubonensis TaxID=101571 RepID=UPI0012F9B44A|nr:hypothetical protein [Burkholderia ubonensis]
MKKAFVFLTAVLMLRGFANVARAEGVGRIFRDDCGLSFLAPPGLEYVEVDGVMAAGNDACYIAFKYTGNLKYKSTEYSPAMPEGWRAMVDLVITVKHRSLGDGIEGIESPGGGAQHGIFDLASKDHIEIGGGDLYVFVYSAKNPTPSMIRLGQSRETILISGNDEFSVSYYLYSSERLMGRKKKMNEVLRNLFLSFQFYRKNE